MFPFAAAAMPIVFQLVGPIVISTIIDRLGKFGQSIDWTKLKLDVDRKVRDIVPGEMLDETVVLFVNRRINAVQGALADTAELKKVLDLLAAGKWEETAKEVFDYAFPQRTASMLSGSSVTVRSYER